MQIQEIEFSEVEQFTDRDRDYTLHSEKFSEFIQCPFEFKYFESLIKDRRSVDTDRKLLKEVIQKQYENLESSSKTKAYIEAIGKEDSFTVTTAHQPSLLTGPLYYVFKILSTINLAEKLQSSFPDQNIIPVFILGGEDHDFEEINHCHIFGKRIDWKSEETGAVGRFNLDGIEQVLEELNEILGDRSQITELVEGFREDMKHSNTYGEFSFRITHRLFDRFGVIILRMDEPRFKSAFSEHIKKEIFESPSQGLIEKSQDRLAELGYDKQAHAREINFFYHNKAGRKRIVQEENIYKVLDTDIQFTQEELTTEIEENAGNFSPNVVMRPLFQEFILPNLAYIGGGGELAYWMERKSQFEHFNIPMPMLIRRNSAMIVDARSDKQIQQLGLTLEDFFMDEHMLVKKYISKSDQPDYSLEKYQEELAEVFNHIDQKIKDIDPTLVKTSQSELAKAKKSIDQLEFKLKRTIKQREEVQLKRISKIKEKLFPSGLQERYTCILEFLSMNGESCLDELLPHMKVFDKNFKIFLIED